MFFNDLINGEKLVFIDFLVEWCGLCKVMVFILKEVVGEIDGKVFIVKIDVDCNCVFVIKM